MDLDAWEATDQCGTHLELKVFKSQEMLFKLLLRNLIRKGVLYENVSGLKEENLRPLARTFVGMSTDMTNGNLMGSLSMVLSMHGVVKSCS